MNIQKEQVTPKKAIQWLKRNIANRPLSDRTSKKYADIMRRGRWRLNGETIKFNRNGDLIDGQHRLTACVESGCSFDVYVVRGLEHDAFDTIDQGKLRTAGDVLARRGEPNYYMLAAALNVVYQITYRGDLDGGKGPVRTDEIVDTLESNPEIRECCSFASGCKQDRLLAPSVVAALLYLFRTVDTAKANEFFKNVCTGENISSSMPEFRLRKRLIENKAAVAKLCRRDICALVIKSWNNARLGKQVKALAFFDREEFPKIHGLQ